MAQSPMGNAATSEVIRYDLGWNAINALLRSGRSLSGHERNCCFLNLGGKRFANVSAATNLDFIDDGRVLALADWDYDGDVDFWIANRSGPQVRYLRNNIDREHHFVAIKLWGKQCNRDAIGARIMLVDSNGQRQFRTRQTGQGYLAQSSSWMHIGLGDADQIARLVVRWPNGRRQAFEQIAVDRFYELHEGDAQLKPWKPPVWPALEPSDFTAPAVSDQARIVLLNPVPLPQLLAADLQDAPFDLARPATRPRLINLWASWCQPCLAELSEWSAHASKLSNAGLEIITVNVDQDNSMSAGLSPQAAELLKTLAPPFQNAWGTDALTTEFDIIQRSLLSRQRPLPIPSSFLIDRQGQLRIVYKGPVTVEQLLHDVTLVDAEREDILAAASPFDGRWLVPPTGSGPLQLAVKFAEANEIDVAERYIQSVANDSSKSKEVSASLFNLLGAMAIDKRDVGSAIQAFRRALQQEPDNRQARIELGTLLLKIGQGAEATTHFEAVLENNPNDPELCYKLGMAHLQTGDLKRAEASLQRASRLRPMATVSWQLGNILVLQHKIKEAIAAYESAIRLDPGLKSSANDLAWLLATADDASVRDGSRAVELAEVVCACTASPSASQLDTLAAAYAEVGRFTAAEQTAERAIAAAREAQESSLAKRIELRRQGYVRREPFRTPLPQPGGP